MSTEWRKMEIEDIVNNMPTGTIILLGNKKLILCDEIYEGDGYTIQEWVEGDYI